MKPRNVYDPMTGVLRKPKGEQPRITHRIPLPADAPKVAQELGMSERRATRVLRHREYIGGRRIA